MLEKNKTGTYFYLITILIFGFLFTIDSQLLFSKSYAENVLENESHLTYEQKVYFATLQMDSVSGYSEQLGLNFMVENSPLNETIEKLQLMEYSLEYYANIFEDDEIPENHNISHSHLISGLSHMQQSLNDLKDSLDQIQAVKGIPRYLISTLLGGDETELTPIYKMNMMNQAEIEQIENARTLFKRSLTEASLMKNNLDDFLIQYDGSSNTTSYQRFEKSLTYFGSSLGCGCELPLDL